MVFKAAKACIVTSLFVSFSLKILAEGAKMWPLGEHVRERDRETVRQTGR